MWLCNGYASSNTVDRLPDVKSLWAMNIKGTLMFKLLKLFIFIVVASIGTPSISETIGRHIASQEIKLSDGSNLSTGATVNFLGVIDVKKSVVPSGKLATFEFEGSIFNADASFFYKALEDGNLELWPARSIDAGNSAKVCARLTRREDNDAVDFANADFKNFFEIKTGGELVSAYTVTRPSDITSWRDSAQEFCISGLEHSTSYSITVLKGLEVERYGQTRILDSSLTVSVKTADVTPSITVSPSQNVLAKNQTPIIPIEWVNLDNVTLNLHRIDIASLPAYGLTLKTLDGTDLRRFDEFWADKLYEGKIELGGALNLKQKRNLDLSRILPNDQDGLFLVTLKSDELHESSYSNLPSQWFSISDISMQLYKGLSSTEVLLKSFKSAMALDDVKLTVLARNNRELFSGLADKTGKVSIPNAVLNGTSGFAPEYIIASSEQHGISILDVNDLNVKPRFLNGGIAKAHSQDIYLTTDRDIYRAGETVELFGVSRRLNLDPLSDSEYTVKLISSSAEDIFEQSISPKNDGSFALSIPLSATQSLGRYYIRIQSLDEVVLAEHTIRLDDFVPLTIDAALDIEEGTWNLDETYRLTINGTYFSGGAASGLKADITTFLKSVNTIRTENLSDFHFGTKVDSSVVELDQFGGKLDETGTFAAITFTDYVLQENALYEVQIEGNVFDIGGRANKAKSTVSLDDGKTYIGVRPRFDDYVAIGDVPSFDIANVKRTGAAQALDDVSYSVHRIYYSYNWYYEDGGWNWNRVRVDDEMIESGVVSNSTLILKSAPSWGRHEIKLTNADGFVTTYEFYVGWGADAKPASEPEELAISYVDGSLNFQAPFDGTLSILLANEDVQDIVEISVQEGAVSIPLDPKLETEPGFHILASIARPIERGSEHLPQIALGKTWVSKIAPERSIKVDLEVDGEIESKTPISVTLKTDAQTGSALLFLVDEGIHALTGYENASLQDHYLAERALNLGILSNFGKLITQDDALQAISVGGDGDLLASFKQADKSEFFKTIALASPLLDIKDGKITYEFPPTQQWEGKLRLVAFTVSQNGFGFEQDNITVQDPVSIDVSLPRFVTPHDTVLAQMNIRWNDYNGPVTVSTRIAAETTEQEFMRGESGQQSLELPIRAKTTGNLPIEIKVQAGTETYTRNFNLISREPSYPSTIIKSVMMREKNWLGFGSNAIKPFTSTELNLDAPNTKVSAFISPFSGETLLQTVEGLNQYPYGCVEQLSSKTRGLIAYTQTLGNSKSTSEKINMGLDKIISYQKPSGEFGYWGRYSYTYDEFQPFAIDTLQKALPYAKNHEKLVAAINKGLDYLYRKNFADLDDQLYAYGLLARSGFEVTSRARYSIDQLLSNDRPITIAPNILELDTLVLAYWVASNLNDGARMAQIAEKLTSYTVRADFKDEMTYSEGEWLDETQIALPLKTGKYFAPRYAHLLTELPNDHITKSINEILLNSRQYLANLRYRSTLTSSKLVALSMQQSNLLEGTNITVNGEATEIGPNGEMSLDLDMLRTAMEINHDASSPLYLNVKATGQRQGLGLQDRGYFVTKWWYDRNGNYIDLGNGVLNVNQGDLFTVVLEIERTKSGTGTNLLVTDLLPSGFEIEDALLETPKIDGMELDFEAGRTPSYKTGMDDRYIAHFDDTWRKGSFAYVRYTVRATHQTASVVPDAHVEEMYNPSVHGRSAMSKAIVSSQ